MISYRDRIAQDLDRMERRVRLIRGVPGRERETQRRAADVDRLRTHLAHLDARDRLR